jgi:hypothetical protein
VGEGGGGHRIGVDGGRPFFILYNFWDGDMTMYCLFFVIVHLLDTGSARQIRYCF